MLRATRDLVLYRLVGGRLMLAWALLGLARRFIGRWTGSARRRDLRYQPSHGTSQIEQREPR